MYACTISTSECVCMERGSDERINEENGGSNPPRAGVDKARVNKRGNTALW